MATDQGPGKTHKAIDQSTRNVGVLLACSDLVHAIKTGGTISVISLGILVDDEPTAAERKALVMGLKCAGLISDERAGVAIYRWNLGVA